jgi:hypothetical protein
MNEQSDPQSKVTIRRVTVLNNVMVIIAVVATIALLLLTANMYFNPSQKQSGSLAEKFNLKRTAVSETDQNAIDDLLRKASNFEFRMYKNAEQPDTTGLSNFFVSGSPAYKKVWQNISGVHERGWSLNCEANASYCAMLEIDVVNSDGKIAEVTTRENWYLDYVTAGTNKSVYTYSQLSSQYYQLKKTPAGWRIFLNHYPTTNVVFED